MSVEDEVGIGKRGQNTSRHGRMEVVVETCSIIGTIMKHDHITGMTVYHYKNLQIYFHPRHIIDNRSQNSLTRV